MVLLGGLHTHTFGVVLQVGGPGFHIHRLAILGTSGLGTNFLFTICGDGGVLLKRVSEGGVLPLIGVFCNTCSITRFNNLLGLRVFKGLVRLYHRFPGDHLTTTFGRYRNVICVFGVFNLHSFTYTQYKAGPRGTIGTQT